jgi:repressor LexA
MDRRFVPSDEAFFVKVKGDSMIGRGINDGDFVMVNPTAQADEGAVIAARLGDEATVKTLTHHGDTIVLEPANPAERPIVVRPEDDFGILGVVCGIFRPFFDAGAFTKPVDATTVQ